MDECCPEPTSAKPARVEPEQPWRVDGEGRDLVVDRVDGDEAALRVRALSTGEWMTWGKAPVSSMLTMRCWTFLGGPNPPEEGGLALAL